MSCAILFTGSLPSKALRLFQVLKCATISRSSFFRHQIKFLQPATLAVWHHHQQTLLSEFEHNQKALIIAGDGRADSPGHSAKYGCYTLVELTCSKVVDFQLVQVCVHVLDFHHFTPYYVIISVDYCSRLGSYQMTTHSTLFISIFTEQ